MSRADEDRKSAERRKAIEDLPDHEVTVMRTDGTSAGSFNPKQQATAMEDEWDAIRNSPWGRMILDTAHALDEGDEAKALAITLGLPMPDPGDED